jgi:predicted TIM-barrel fold metal-dependent hydrolase
MDGSGYRRRMCRLLERMERASASDFCPCRGPSRSLVQSCGYTILRTKKIRRPGSTGSVISSSNSGGPNRRSERGLRAKSDRSFFAYIFAVPGNREEEYSRVTAENDWVVQQVASYPGRLIGFCGVNPLRDYAVREIQRCKEIGLRGLKLHFSNPNTDIDFGNNQQLAQLKVVFSAANQARMAIIVHLRPWRGTNYGAAQARSFIETVLPAAHDVPVQIAHMAGYGADPIRGLVDYDRATDEALGAFIAALHSGQIKRQNLYFDFSGVLLPEASDEASRRVGRRPANQQQLDFPDWISRKPYS